MDTSPADARPTSRFLDQDGAPSEAILAFCRASKPKAREIEPDVLLQRTLNDTCRLSFDRPPSGDGLVPLLLSISMSRHPEMARLDPSATLWDEGFVLVRSHRLTMRFGLSEGRTRGYVSWEPYLLPDAIIGTAGRLLAGVDIAGVIGRPATSLRKAVSRDYEVEPMFCSSTSCTAYGPRLPGGYGVKVAHWRRSVLVTLSSESADRTFWREVRELVAASLGPGQPQGPDTDYVFIRDGLRYAWHEERGADS